MIRPDRHRERTPLLNRSEHTDAEKAAQAMGPRPGWVFVAQVHDEITYDALDQETTDALIVRELRDFHVPGNELDDFERMVSQPPSPSRHRSQIGGVHSDPFVRLLAFRAWGTRDSDFKSRPQ